MAFFPGWEPRFGAAAESRLDTSGRYCLVAAPTKPPRPAVSLSRYRLGYYLQGEAGTCFCHAPKQMAEVTAEAMGYEAFPVCRRLLAWVATQMEGGQNPADGGSPTDCVIAMTSKGVGMAHEDLLPYSDDRNVLAQKPPQAVFDDAAKIHLDVPVKVKSVNDMVNLIDVAQKPTANGYMVASEMQQGSWKQETIGNILGGHSQLIWGYARPGVFDEHLWLELENWWGLIYDPLPPSLAKMVDGYEPVNKTGRTTSKWVRSDIYVKLCNMSGGSEHISATDFDGLSRGEVIPGPSFAEGLI